MKESCLEFNKLQRLNKTSTFAEQHFFGTTTHHKINLHSVTCVSQVLYLHTMKRYMYIDVFA